MKNLLGIITTRRSLLRASLCAPLCFGVLAGGAGPSKPQTPTRNEVNIVNKTTTLEVVALQPTDHNLHSILLKNVSSKDLNGYTVAVNRARMTKDISSGDRVISPGQTDELEIPIDSSPTNLIILAAMFTDGSIEGEEVVVSELKEWRLGLKKQLARFLSVLDAALELPHVNAAATLDKLESEVSSLSIESDTAHPHSTRGSREGRDDLISSIQVLRNRRQRQGALMQRQRLLDLKGRIERRIASL